MISLQCRAGIEAQTKKFEGIAYSGGIIPGTYLGNVVIDLSTTHAPTPMAILLEHERSQRIGVGVSITLGAEMRVNGYLLDNELGHAVATESAEGFPWQMSVHVEPRQVDEVLAQQSQFINGRTIYGPVSIFRNALIREISFTPTGMDSNTWAIAASRNNPLLADVRQRYLCESPHKFSTNPLIKDAKQRGWL